MLKGFDVMEVTSVSLEYMQEKDVDSEEILTFLMVQSKNYAKRVEMKLLANILMLLVAFGVVVYFVRFDYQNRIMAMQYADKLKEYQATLEDLGKDMNNTLAHSN